MQQKASQSSELWHVQHGFNPERVMTRANVEAAYRLREINIRALVRKDGAAQWQTLGDLLEIDADDTLESISLMPVASDVALPEIPKSAPLPELPALVELGAPPPRARKPFKALSLAVVLAVGGTVFVGVSAYLGGSDPAPVTATIAVPPPPEAAPVVAPAASLAILEEGSIFVLAKAEETPAPAKKPVTPKKKPASPAPAKKAR